MHLIQNSRLLLASAVSFSLAISPLASLNVHAQNAPSAEAPGDAGWQREFEAWRAASKTGTAKDYEAYIKAFPSGKFAGVAKKRLDALNGVKVAETKTEGTIKAPEADKTADVAETAATKTTDTAETATAKVEGDAGTKDLELWRQVSKTGTKDDYEKYLKAFPKGKFAKVAKTRIDALIAKATPAADDSTKVAAQDDTAKAAPVEDQAADAADEALPEANDASDVVQSQKTESAVAGADAGDDADAQESDTQEADAGQAAEKPAAATPGSSDWEQEYALWKEASNGNTVAEYEAYLSTYPKGKFAAIAQARIVALAAAEAPVADVAEGDEQPADDKPAKQDARANQDDQSDQAADDQAAQQPDDATQPSDDMANADQDTQSSKVGQRPDAERQAQLSEGTPESEDEFLDREMRHELQGRLTALGYDTFGTDGSFGPRSRSAISGWQQDNGAPVSGYLSIDQAQLIQKQSETAYAEWLASQPEVVERPRRNKVVVREKVIVEERNPALDAAIAVGVIGAVVGAHKFGKIRNKKRIKIRRCKKLFC